MKYFEFNGNFGYYALIGADSIDEAMDLYGDAVADIREDDGLPDEITKEEAEAKYNSTVSAIKKDSGTTDSFETIISESPCLILIDGDLV
jgi:hypothetical protein